MISINSASQSKQRTIKNWCICLLGFAIWAWAWAYSGSRFLLLADTVGILIAYYIFFYVLENRASYITCPHCKRLIATNTPWLCGVCEKHNLRVEDFPFTYKCEGCGAEPKAYMCHHPECSQLIFLSDDKQKLNFASCLIPKLHTPPDKQAERTEAMEAKSSEVALQKLEIELGKLRAENNKANEKPKSLDEEIKADLERHYTRWMGYEAHAKKKMAEIDKEFKDDPKARKKAHDIIKNWLKDKM